MLFRQIPDPKLAQYAYLVGCQKTKEALLIDPQRDVDRYVEAAEAEGLRITAVAETHIHADYVSGARELADRVRQNAPRITCSDESGRWFATCQTTRSPAKPCIRHHGKPRLQFQSVPFWNCFTRPAPGEASKRPDTCSTVCDRPAGT